MLLVVTAVLILFVYSDLFGKILLVFAYILLNIISDWRNK
jgi:phage shock protein PspC (stress-responsive transcriptional regulator)